MSLAVDSGPAVRPRSAGRLSAGDIAAIVADLKDWSRPKITWNAVVMRVQGLIGRRFSRQSLEAQPAIYRAYAEAKRRLRMGLPPARRKPLAERIEALQVENKGLRQENEVLLEMFVTWLLNAESFGLRAEQLDEALPAAALPSDTRERELRRREEKKAKVRAIADRRRARRNGG
ncbi:hypothetical protein CT676_38005 [Bradyrhizobium sp. MOS001]|uniref:hypothetical protein n=1 Tax=Bradyrhizobium sp. MOS001 TaxID=2133948 RepID=UPI00107552AD|nr:hypothetical protein [Bradyrhizobium sp. MOS001]TFW55930.1 hypothetical protein CT676_38005 [Bradyrhizobium sp. MOS001]